MADNDVRDEWVEKATLALDPIVPNHSGGIWEFQHEDGQHQTVTLHDAARAAIAAVADDIRAQALREAADAASKLLSTPDGRVGEIRAWTNWLRARAEEVDHP